MITELLIAGETIFAGTLIQAGKSSKIDAEAMKKYAKAFSREESARILIEKKEAEADQSITRLAKRKKAILETSINDFIEMYKEIQKIQFTEGNGIKEITALTVSNATVNRLQSLSISCGKPLTDKELVVGMLFKGMAFGGGIGGMMIEESKRNLSAANSQVRASNVAYSQAETIAVVYEAIKERSDRMSDLLKRMNAGLVMSIDETKRVLSANGLNVKNYSNENILVIVNCVNWLKATKEIIDTPLFDVNGQLEESAVHAIEIGEQFINKINMQL